MCLNNTLQDNRCSQHPLKLLKPLNSLCLPNENLVNKNNNNKKENTAGSSSNVSFLDDRWEAWHTHTILHINLSHAGVPLSTAEQGNS